MIQNFRGKNVFITGTRRGIGRELVRAFAMRGASIYAHARKASEEFEAHNAELAQNYGVTIRPVYFDMTDENAMKAAVQEIMKEMSPHILINNAGICKLNKVLDFGRADWDPMIDVNLTAAFELSYEAAKIMIPQKSGKIINICSLFSYLGGQWSPAYSATKHALAGFTKAYCDELGQYNIQVNGIAPGYYATDITLATRSNPETNQRVLDHIPANRWGDTQDLMGAAVFLASPASNYVNGHLLVVDGGYLVR